MHTLQTHIKNYLEYCNTQKCLDAKTLKAYRIDLQQFSVQLTISDTTEITSSELENYIAELHQKYKPKTAKRNIASVKSLFHYLEYKETIDRNPFSKIQIRFREPIWSGSSQNDKQILEPLRDASNSFEGTNQKYDETFKGSLMRNGAYYKCGFKNVTFEGTIGNNYIFKSSNFTDCSFAKAN